MNEGATKRGSVRARFGAIAAMVALGVVAAIVGGRALLDPGANPAASSRVVGRPDARGAADPLVASESANAPSTAKPDDAAVAATPARTAEAPPAAPADAVATGPMAEPREGTIVVVDRDGGEHAEESGSFKFERFDPSFEERLARGSTNDDANGDDAPDPARAPVEVAVVRGRFVLDAARYRAIRLDAIELGGRLAIDDDVIKVARSTPILVRALWVEPVLLHVQDAATRAELDDVTVLVQSEWMIDSPDHPGGEHPDDVVGRGLRSPFALQPPLVRERRRLRAHYWVFAPGHAWNSVSLQFDEGGEETVELEPAASLTVVIGSELVAHAIEQESDPLERVLHRQRPPPPPKAFVRLRRRPTDSDDVAKETAALRQVDAGSLGGIVAEVAAHDGEVRFEGLAPGERLATLEVGERNDPSLLIAFAAVSLHAGESPSVTLARAEPRRVALAGTLFVPPSWDAAQVALRPIPTDRRSRNAIGAERVLPLRSMAAVAARHGLYRWRFDDVTPGQYELSVDRSIGTTWIEVGPDGRDDVQIELPDVAHVTAHIVDAESGAPVEVPDLLWFSRRSGDRSFGGNLRPMVIGRGSTHTASSFTMTCAVGMVRFEVQSLDWRVDDQPPEFAIVAGEQQIDVRVRRTCGVDVEFRIDGKEAPWDFDGPLLTVAPMGEVLSSISRARTAVNDGARFVVPAPGWYRITVPKLEGFAAVAPIDVLVEAAGFVTRTIELQRE